MAKRIAIIGRGTAGSQNIIHFLRYAKKCEIEWYYDPNVPVQSVGEGSTLALPANLYQNFNFNYINLNDISSTIKMGVYKSNWGKNAGDFLHQFKPPHFALHFNAVSLQNYIFNKVKNKVKIIESSVSPNNIDADYVMDCSGKPETYENFHLLEYIPVNSAYITQCYWDYPRFNYTLTIARPYGWVFGVPLQNRCSIGYLYNQEINNIDDVRKDVENIFEEYNLIPSNDTNSLSFKNYYRIQNYTERVCYNGNASFFLEPMEANSIENISVVQKYAFDVWAKNIKVEDANLHYKKNILEVQDMIMLHYFSGSKYDTNFWKFAQEKGKQCIENSLKNDEKFAKMIRYALKVKKYNLCEDIGEYGGWPSGAFFQNIEGLGIKNSLLKLV